MALVIGSLFFRSSYNVVGLNHRFTVLGFTVALLFYNSMDALPIFFKVALKGTLFFPLSAPFTSSAGFLAYARPSRTYMLMHVLLF